MFSIKGYLGEELELIRDPIYGFIEFPAIFEPVIDNKFTQRLRWIGQLPLEQLVYPSAQHSRFEHSLGTMFLAMQSAVSLINDEISLERLKKAFQGEKLLQPYKDDDRIKIFILSAGLIGLLHDVGHAPFSHTLENSINLFLKEIYNFNFHFDHEDLTYILAKEILKDTSQFSPFECLPDIVLQVLNKKKRPNSPFIQILRSLIDGPVDVDKGDYLLRDSYHCGVSYGVYDKDRLWRHIRITENFSIGVSEKGALEAWTLRFCRFKMHHNVYKHHVRNITDAMLAEIISKSLAELLRENKKSEAQRLYPFINVTSLKEISELGEEELFWVLFWNDNEFLKQLNIIVQNSSSNTTLHYVKVLVERFMKRKLYKRFVRIDETSVCELGLTFESDKGRIAKVLHEFVEEKRKEREDLLFIIWEREPPPVFDKNVQRAIKVVKDSGEEEPLASFIGFDIESIILSHQNETNNIDIDIEKSLEPVNIFCIDIFSSVKRSNSDIVREEILERLSQLIG